MKRCARCNLPWNQARGTCSYCGCASTLGEDDPKPAPETKLPGGIAFPSPLGNGKNILAFSIPSKSKRPSIEFFYTWNNGRIELRWVQYFNGTSHIFFD